MNWILHATSFWLLHSFFSYNPMLVMEDIFSILEYVKES